MSTASLCAFSGKLSPRSRCALSEEVTKSEDMKSCFIKISDENVIADLKRLGVKINCRFGEIVTAQIPVGKFFIGDKNLGGFEEPDSNAIEWSFFPNWSDDLDIVKASEFDYNPLTDLVNVASD